MRHIPHFALLTSSILYPGLLRILAGPTPSPVHLSASVRAISTLHSTLLTSLALYILHHRPPSPPSSLSLIDGYPDDASKPLIQARSPLANSAAAIEAGYLLSSIPTLLHEARLHSRRTSKAVLAHHVGIGAALLVLQYYVLCGKERGIYVIVAFLLMNASTPLLNARWYVRTFHKEKMAMVRVVDAAFAVAFFAARVALVPGIVGCYGRVHGMGLSETLGRLRVPCQVGTAGLWVANSVWWVALMKGLVREWKRDVKSD